MKNCMLCLEVHISFQKKVTEEQLGDVYLHPGPFSTPVRKCQIIEAYSSISIFLCSVVASEVFNVERLTTDCKII